MLTMRSVTSMLSSDQLTQQPVVTMLVLPPGRPNQTVLVLPGALSMISPIGSKSLSTTCPDSRTRRNELKRGHLTTASYSTPPPTKSPSTISLSLILLFTDASSYDVPIDFDEEDPDDIENDINFSPEVIRNFLRKVKPAKAAGPDGIHGMILKNCDIGLAGPLSIIFRMSYNTGIIPKEWKVANVVPVHKKGSKSDVKNYRPISLTSLIVKVFERVVRDKLMEKCKDQLCPNQHGFLPAKSCTTQMIEVNESLAFTLNSKSQADIV